MIKQSMVLGWVLGSVIALSAVAQERPASVADNRVLRRVVSRVLDEAKRGRDPLIVVDIDDTLIDTRLRTRRVFQDFAKEPGIRRKYRDESATLVKIARDSIRYELSQTLKEAGIANPGFEKALTDYWIQNFFSDEYSAQDQAFPGAPAFVRALRKAGGRVLYLTGRDEPRMKKGTRIAMLREGFPLDEGATIQMKPDKAEPDEDYKKRIFEELQKTSNVVSVFENEPRNVNLMKEAFPESVAVFIKTSHSNKPDRPRRDVGQISGYGKYVSSRARPEYRRRALQEYPRE